MDHLAKYADRARSRAQSEVLHAVSARRDLLLPWEAPQILLANAIAATQVVMGDPAKRAVKALTSKELAIATVSLVQ